MLKDILSDKNVMLDLETMGNNPDSPIVSIGAVAFGKDLDFTKEKNQLFIPVSLGSSFYYGAKPDASTIMWWLKQSKAARQVIYDAKGLPLKEALEKFNAWFPKGSKVWGNGVGFDNVILTSAYGMTMMRRPWPYTHDRCFRTLRQLFPVPDRPRTGTYHDPVDDCLTQIKHLVDIIEAYA